MVFKCEDLYCALFPNEMSSFRVPIGTSMFDKPPQPDPKYNNDMYYCNCNQAKKQVDCRLDGKASRPALHVSVSFF